MKKTVVCVVLSLCITLNLISCTKSKTNRLVCDTNGDFTILIVSDPQCDTPAQWQEAKNELETLITRAKPNFVLINGDMNSNNKIPTDMWDLFISPLTERGIYWSTTNGNHDPFTERYYQMYKSHSLCLNSAVSKTDPNFEAARPMNYVIPVYSNDNKTLVFAIYGMDTGTANQNGYEGLTDKQIKWYKSQSDMLKRKNGREVVTSLLCMHIPLPQVVDMYYSTEKEAKLYKVYGIANEPNFNTKNYTCENGTVVSKTYLHTTAKSNDRGMLEAVLKQGDIKAIIFGHDHQTNIVGSYKGVILGFAGKISTGCYSDELCRGGRVIKLNQSNPEDFTVSWLGAIETSPDQPPIYYDGTLAK